MPISIKTHAGILTSTEGEWTSDTPGLAELAEEYLLILSNQTGPWDPWQHLTEAENIAEYLSGKIIRNTDTTPESVENIVY